MVLRKRPRKHRASPVRGLSLLASGVDRLGLWPKLWEQWVCRTFALTLHRCVPRLSAFTRAEKLADGIRAFCADAVKLEKLMAAV